ncbi:MAG: hypothetical protein CVU00_11310 [Bacteroidetes bacterium HGW-Bacteroidetes-17]|jgi:hypothetical protein|nr:MAG: hypothetical protein CVU00_11310 [Bacteroidetes bacterium HGW-Bacteroidetes-17]
MQGNGSKIRLRLVHQQKSISPRTIVFSKWSRKKYAIFASLGKLIKIGVLKAEICQKALLKGHVDLGNIIGIKENPYEDETDSNLAAHDSLQFMLSSLGPSVFPAFILTSNSISKKVNPLEIILFSEYKVCFLPSVRNRFFFDTTGILQII